LSGTWRATLDQEHLVEARTAEISAADTARRESEMRYRTIVDSVIDCGPDQH